MCCAEFIQLLQLSLKFQPFLLVVFNFELIVFFEFSLIVCVKGLYFFDDKAFLNLKTAELVPKTSDQILKVVGGEILEE
jgi:hypothetical protein